MKTSVPGIIFRTITAVFCLLMVISCTDPSTIIYNGEIPEDVLDLAGGIFSLIGMVFDSDYEDPTDDPSYPTGISVAWITEPTALQINLSSFTPEDWGGVVADGYIALTQTNSSPLTITVEGPINLTGHPRSSTMLSGTATWPMGGDISEDEPESITGTFTVDGIVYDLAAIMAAMPDDGDDGDGTTTTHTPLPEVFRTSNGDFTQSFDDQVWRIGPAAADAHWSPYSYMTFSISADGTRHTVYLAGVETNAGEINWYTTGGEQKLDFLDSADSALYSFTVLAYTKNHLHLLSSWGSETREWIFAAGTNNLSGVVVDSAVQIPEPPCIYNKPIAGAVAQLGTLDGGMAFTPIGGLTATTDTRGYFEFDDLSAYVNTQVAVRVTKTGYQDLTSPPVPGESVSSSSTIFKYISLTP